MAGWDVDVDVDLSSDEGSGDDADTPQTPPPPPRGALDDSVVLVPSAAAAAAAPAAGHGGDPFEIVDHTSASPWESFVTSIEDLLHLWRLHGDDDDGAGGGRGERRARPGHTFELLSFAGASYTLAYDCYAPRPAPPHDAHAPPHAHADEVPAGLARLLGAPRADFAHGEHLARWFGLRELLVLAPEAADADADGRQAELLLSSLCIALANTRCTVPAFVPVGGAWREHFTGYALVDNVQIRFDTTLRDHVPRTHAHLAGLTDLFASKLNYGASVPRNSLEIRCAARLTFKVAASYENNWRQAVFRPPGADYVFWGPRWDPIEDLQLGAVWPDFAEYLIADNQASTDLEAANAPVWTLTRKLGERVSHPMSNALDVLVATAATALDASLDSQPGSPRPSYDDPMFASTTVNETDETAPSGFAWDSAAKGGLPPGERDDFAGVRPEAASRTSSGGSGAARGARIVGLIGSTLGSALGRQSSDALPTEDELDDLRALLLAPREPVVLRDYYQDVDLRLDRACPKGSLTWQIAMQVLLSAADTSVQRLALIWNRIVHEIRQHWEKSVLLVRMGTDAPDHRACLLHQKLQLFNYCVKRKRQEEQYHFRQSKSSPRRTRSGKSPRASLAVGEDEMDGVQSPALSSEPVETENELFAAGQTADSKLSREGALRPLQGVYLKNHLDELVYEPMTQEIGFMTEDMLDQQQQQLADMGTTTEATLARARLQTVSLQSDMEAFKAANPDAELEDFVRWHSPNDWVDGRMSARMTEPSNLWQTTWTSAEAVPAHRQRPLFRFEQEAMKVLHYLENISVAELLQQVLPTAFLVACESLTVQRDLFAACEPLRDGMAAVHARLRAVDWDDVGLSLGELSRAVQAIRRIELQAATALSLLSKIGPSQRDLVARMLLARETELLSDAERNAVDVYFIERGGPQIFAEPVQREFVLRALSPQPSPASRVLLHRLYACITGYGMRLAEAYAHDTLFF